MIVPYKPLSRIAPYITRVAPRVLPALGFAAGIVSVIFFATKYMDSLPGPYNPKGENDDRSSSGKSIDDKLIK